MGIYNEAKRIEECLQYHLPYVDEAVIVIQESDDNTEKITEDYMRIHSKIPYKILKFPKMGCSEATLYKGANALNTDWILYVDADEKFPKAFLEKMHEHILTQDHDAFRFERDNYFDVQIFADSVPIEPKVIRVKHPARDQQVRLSRKSISIFPPQIHCRVRVRGKDGQEKIYSSSDSIFHLKSLDEQWIDNKSYKPATEIVNAMEKTKHQQLIKFPLINSEKNGKLIFAEAQKLIPFEIKRIFYIFDTYLETLRGGHANKKVNEVLVCLKGSVKVSLDDGVKKREFILNDPTQGLFIKNNWWVDMTEFTNNTILLCFASEYYNEKEYIRDYQTFKSHFK